MPKRNGKPAPAAQETPVPMKGAQMAVSYTHLDVYKRQAFGCCRLWSGAVQAGRKYCDVLNPGRKRPKVFNALEMQKLAYPVSLIQISPCGASSWVTPNWRRMALPRATAASSPSRTDLRPSKIFCSSNSMA